MIGINIDDNFFGFVMAGVDRNGHDFCLLSFLVVTMRKASLQWLYFPM